MRDYIGCKMVSAEPAFRVNGEIYPVSGPVPKSLDREEGYKVRYPDGYESWSPKEVFEKAYLQIDENKDLPSEVSIGPKMVEEFISYYETQTHGDRTTVVYCVLRNGFTIVESSACVDPENYSEEIGKEICLGKIRDKIWELLGFMLQTAVNGVNN